jgi:mannose-6-phosphate isomerase-like protein (cupin superfamily)
MKTKLPFAIALTMLSFGLSGRAQEPDGPASASPSSSPAAASESSPTSEASADAPVFKNLSDLKWEKILPDLGESSPEICFLRVDPKTKATQLLIRSPKAIHVRRHWHSANETHTIVQGTVAFACDGKRMEQGPGSFNFMPAKMVHEAWLPAGSLTFITVDGAWDINWVEGPPTSADLSRAH